MGGWLNGRPGGGDVSRGGAWLPWYRPADGSGGATDSRLAGGSRLADEPDTRPRRVPVRHRNHRRVAAPHAHRQRLERGVPGPVVRDHPIQGRRRLAPGPRTQAARESRTGPSDSRPTAPARSPIRAGLCRRRAPGSSKGGASPSTFRTRGAVLRTGEDGRKVYGRILRGRRHHLSVHALPRTLRGFGGTRASERGS